MLNSQETKECQVALMELHTLGLIEFKDDERFSITDKGIERAIQIVNELPASQRILVMLGMSEVVRDSPLEQEAED